MEISNVKFSTKSMVDDFGRVFFFNNKVYRAIQPEKEEYCRELLSSDLFKELNESGFLPETKIANIDIIGYNLILEHERLHEIQQHEWSYEMFRSAALMVIKVNNICNKHGYELKDAHTFNVLFRGVKPVWVDIGSISPIININSWIAFDEFKSVFFIPIQFYLQNDSYIVRKLVESNFYRMQTAPFQSLWESKLIDLLNFKPFLYNFSFRNKNLKTTFDFDIKINKFVRRFNKYYHKVFIKPALLFKYEKTDLTCTEIEKYIADSNLKNTESQWSNYHRNNYNTQGEVIISSRFNRLIELINYYCKDAISAIDLAGNEGFFTSLLIKSTELKSIILTDYDSNAIDTAYIYFNNKKIKNVSVALLNFMFTIGIEDTCKRLKSDIAIALAVTHHLILSQQYSINIVFERLSAFSDKYVVIEFMPLGLWSIHTKTGTTTPEWYNQEWFEGEFIKYFKILHIEQLEENRIVYVGEKY